MAYKKDTWMVVNLQTITFINLSDFLKNFVFHNLLNFDILVLTGLQDADGNFSGNLVKDNRENSARVFKSVMMAT